MAFHNFTTNATPPKNLRSLLGLSLKFVPNPRYNVNWKAYNSTILPRLVNDLKVKTFMACKLQDVDNEDDDYNKRMYVKTGWTPPEHLFPFPPELPRRLRAFEAAIKSLVRRRKCSNLLPHQSNALDYLQNQRELLVVQCDKNLGPAIIERDEYIKMIFRDHLNDTTTYRQLTDPEAKLHARRIIQTIKDWLKCHAKILKKDEKRFIKHHLEKNEEPFAAFYATMKAHKPPPLRSRPIISCPGCLTQAIGVWVDDCATIVL